MYPESHEVQELLLSPFTDEDFEAQKSEAIFPA